MGMGNEDRRRQRIHPMIERRLPAVVFAVLPANAAEDAVAPHFERAVQLTELEHLDALSGVYEQIEAALRAQLLAFVRIDPATRENEWRSVQGW